MSEMRLIVAGAGGRMGRTLIAAIAATEGVTLAGAVEAAGSAVIGRDAGELAGLGTNGVAVATDLEPLLAGADGLLDFTIPAATVAFAELLARKNLVHIIGTTGLSHEDETQSDTRRLRFGQVACNDAAKAPSLRPACLTDAHNHLQQHHPLLP